MRISDKEIKELQILLRDELGLVYTDEEAQRVGLAIMRFTFAKLRKNELTKVKEKSDGNNKVRVGKRRQTNASNTNN